MTTRKFLALIGGAALSVGALAMGLGAGEARGTKGACAKACCGEDCGACCDACDSCCDACGGDACPMRGSCPAQGA